MLAPPDLPTHRLRLVIRGAVQGVGFRPFVHRLASQLGLTGWINNTVQGLVIEVEGRRPGLEKFQIRLQDELPPRSFIHSLEAAWLDTVGYSGFEIRVSELTGPRTAIIAPDLATCPDCVRELFDYSDRRYFYPFLNCTNCGPRYSIIEALPYDRAHTAMKKFRLCPQCRAEFLNPRDRRFHAQPTACPRCGPSLAFWDRRGRALATWHDAVLLTAQAIRQGKIVAVKGLGGFHLVVSALDERAVARLRQLKQREEKPFALMFPSLAAVAERCEVEPLEERLLRSPEAPIVLLPRKAVWGRPKPGSLASNLAPGNPCLGAMLPYTPLHHLLLRELGFPIVATSGNVSDEPICTDEKEALQRLGAIADYFLVHNRPIVRRVDDSVVRVVMGRELVLRRARGYAPLPLTLPAGSEETILAVGGHLKNSLTLTLGPLAVVSQHIGDLDTEPSLEAFRATAADLQSLYATKPAVIVADTHPDYLSTQWARQQTAPANGAPRFVEVQHHLAHVAACIADNELELPVLGVSWDGTGLGTDGTIWGGEFLRVRPDGWERVAHLRTFPLPGGDAAAREPRRAALGLLFELLGEAVFDRGDLATLQAFSAEELTVLRSQLASGVNTPRASSMGRLFDAVASFLNLRQTNRFEGQAAMSVEFALEIGRSGLSYPLPLASRTDGPALLDWAPLVQALLAEIADKALPGTVASKFQNALADGILAVAQQSDCQRVVLSGGCFQNRYLLERAVTKLQAAGFRAYWHQRVPPNDGGLSLGQAAAVRLGLAGTREVTAQAPG